jgi:hypothetical protein
VVVVVVEEEEDNSRQGDGESSDNGKKIIVMKCVVTCWFHRVLLCRSSPRGQSKLGFSLFLNRWVHKYLKQGGYYLNEGAIPGSARKD